MRRIAIFFIIFILFCPLVLRAEELTLSLDEAIAIALRDNRDILLQAKEVEKAKAKIAEARAGLWPTFTAYGGWAYTTGAYNNDKGQFATQLNATQYLYRGGSVINTIKYDGHKLESAQAVLDKVKLNSILYVQNAFYTLLLSVDFSGINKGILENTKEHLEYLRARYKNGESSESDILKIESSLSSIEEAYTASVNDIEAAEALLRNLLYLDESVKIKAVGEFKYQPQEVEYDAAFLKAMQNRPEIRQYEAEEKAQAKAVDINKASNRPSIYASWDYYSNSHVLGPQGPEANWNDSNIIGVGFSWPIFDGWLTKSKVEQAIVGLKQTQLLKEKSIKDIALELKDAYLGLKNALAKINSAEKDLVFYKDIVSVYKTKYQDGMASLLDLHDATLGYEVSLFNQKQAIYDYLIAKDNFDKATGGL